MLINIAWIRVIMLSWQCGRNERPVVGIHFVIVITCVWVVLPVRLCAGCAIAGLHRKELLASVGGRGIRPLSQGPFAKFMKDNACINQKSNKGKAAKV